MRGLMFTAENTIANLEGRKTRTSRTYGLKKINLYPDNWTLLDLPAENVLGAFYFQSKLTGNIIKIKCPFGQVGSELYGKETYDPLMNTQHTAVEKVIYKADYPKEALENESCDFGPWKSPMMMPEWASRYHIILNKIIVQRLQDISIEDIIQEGLSTTLREHDACKDLRKQWINLWDSINLKSGHGWNKNEWVWGLYYTVKLKDRDN